jgi:hypothetical protein
VALRGCKEVRCTSNLTTVFNAKAPDASLTLCHQTALTWPPVHPTLVSVAPNAKSLPGTSPLRLWSRPLQFSQLPHHRPPRRRHFPCIVRRGRAVSTRTANSPSRNAVPASRLKHLSADTCSATCSSPRQWPHDPFLGTRLIQRRRLRLCPGRHVACNCGPWRRRGRQGRRRGRCVVELGRHSGQRARRSGFQHGRRRRSWSR